MTDPTSPIPPRSLTSSTSEASRRRSFTSDVPSSRHPDVTVRLAASGHVIGHHGYAHRFSRYLRPRTLAADMQQGLDVFADLGLRPALYRPPWLLRMPRATGNLPSTPAAGHLRKVLPPPGGVPARRVPDRPARTCEDQAGIHPHLSRRFRRARWQPGQHRQRGQDRRRSTHQPRIPLHDCRPPARHSGLSCRPTTVSPAATVDRHLARGGCAPPVTPRSSSSAPRSH